ncbi:MAG: hypothetical protein JNJ54_21220 [Myxococcaceae bacterium]|nr:hypothetical protein [Myxococcaceae bacterium]
MVNVLARRVLLVLAGAGAVLAVLGGLARLGVWSMGASVAPHHGPLLAVGVFGAVIGLERAVALAHPAALAPPVLNLLGAAALLAGFPFAPWVLVGGVALLVVVNGVIVRRQREAFTWLMLAGSAVLLAGTVGWALGQPVYAATPAWLGFFVLTIAAERLELSRLIPTPAWAPKVLLAVALVLVVTAGVEVVEPLSAGRPFGVGLTLVGLWQLRFDLARRTVRGHGLPKFTAVGVLGAALWLTVTGVLWVTVDRVPAGPRADALLHGVFVGYVLSMVFAHAPIILPAVARVPVPFHAVLYAPLALLHVGLLLRVVGDLAVEAVRGAGGVLTALALPLFAVAVLVARWQVGAPTERVATAP